MKTTNWPNDERPREKLIALGAHTLSDAELLAILINTGVQGTTAVDLSKTLLSHFGCTRNVFSATQKEFEKLRGFGKAKYAVIAACVELNKRSMQQHLIDKKSFTEVESTSNYLSVLLRDKRSEVFSMLLLDSQHQFIAYREMFQGTINSAAVYPRELVKQALEDNAAAVILAHNHPSGVAEPSQADIQITHRIQKAMQLVDIKVLDHFVIGESLSVSFAQRGLI